MPIVTLPNPTSPIENGVNGFVSADAAQLREGVLELLEDERKAAVLGAAARKTALERFPIDRFRDRWRHVLLTATAGASPDELRDALAS
jgi:glycosyltransferase involved in cell wall biosynthesis